MWEIKIKKCFHNFSILSVCIIFPNFERPERNQQRSWNSLRLIEFQEDSTLLINNIHFLQWNFKIYYWQFEKQKLFGLIRGYLYLAIQDSRDLIQTHLMIASWNNLLIGWWPYYFRMTCEFEKKSKNLFEFLSIHQQNKSFPLSKEKLFYNYFYKNTQNHDQTFKFWFQVSFL